MSKNSKRDLYLKIRVSQEEMNTIKRKFQNSGMETLSGFVRAMIFEGYIVQMDGYKLQEIYLSCKKLLNLKLEKPMGI